MPICKYKSLFLGCFTAVIAVLFLCVTPVYATDRYGTTVTMTENSYNRNLLTMPDLSTKEKTQTTTQTIVLDDNARVRADQGELRLSASVRVGANGSRTNTRELTVTCFDAAGKSLAHWTHKSDSYSVSHHWNNLSVENKTIPKGTCSIRYYVYNHIGTSGSLETYNCNLIIKDVVAPSISFLSVSCDDGKQLTQSHGAGTQLSYQVLFSEAVTLSGYPQWTISPVSNDNITTFVFNENGKSILQANYVIPKSGEVISDNYRVALLGISTFTFKDGASNSTTKALDADDISGFNALIGKNGNIYMDNRPPELTGITSDGFSKNSVLNAGKQLNLTLSFHENIQVNGTPSIIFSNGSKAVYVESDTTTNKAEFTCTVTDGSDTDSLTIASFDFSGICDAVGQPVTDSTRLSEFTGQWIGYMDDYNVRIDTAAPYVTGWSYAAEVYDENHPVRLDVMDDGCGITSVQYAFHQDKDENITVWHDAMEENGQYITGKPSKEGLWYLSVITTDEAGNTSDSYTIPDLFTFDLNAPEIELSYTSFEGMNVNASVVVKDTFDSAPKISYTWKDPKTDQTVETGTMEESGAVTCPIVSGVYELTVSAMDSHGHTSEEKMEVLVDVDAPELSLQCETSGYEKSHVIEVIAADEHTCVDSITYRWLKDKTEEDVPWVTLTDGNTITSPANKSGDFILEVCVKDFLKNQTQESMIVQLDNTAPQVQFTPDGNQSKPGEKQYEVHVVIKDEITPESLLNVSYALSNSDTQAAEWIPVEDPTGLFITIPMDENAFIHVQATDTCGNTATVISKMFVKDVQAPSGTVQHADNGYSSSVTTKLLFDMQDDCVSKDRMEMQIRVDEGQWSDYMPYASDYEVTIEPVEGKHTVQARFRDVIGNVSDVYEAQIIYDVTPPQISVSFDHADPTNLSVTATATASDGTWITSSQHVFTENGTFTFSCVDEAGNVAEKKVSVDWIDTTAPSFTMSSLQADQKAHQSAQFTMECSDSDFDHYLYRWNENDPWMETEENSFTLADTDGTFIVQVCCVDQVGNQSAVQQLQVKLDNTAPLMQMKYSPSIPTAMPVRARWTFEDASPVTVIKPQEGINDYVFTQNDKVVFRFVDEAGNTGEYEAEVTWIDPSIVISKAVIKDEQGNIIDASQPLNHAVYASFEIMEGQRVENICYNGIPVTENSPEVEVIDEENHLYRILSWGELSYDVYDEASDTSVHQMMEICVDTMAPECKDANVSCSTSSWTNQPVTVRISPEDDHSRKLTYLLKTTVNGEDVYEANPSADTYVFTENGTHTFWFADEAGNRNHYSVTVDWIDTGVPVPTVVYTVNDVLYNPDTWTNKPVKAYLAFDNTLSPMAAAYEHTFEANGSVTFHYSNLAGTKGEITVSVDHIDLIAPTGTFTADHDTWTNQDVTVTLHGSDEQSGAKDMTYVFTENGEHVFELYDQAGNKSIYAYNCDWIDKTPPEISVQYSPQNNGKTPFNVYAFAMANETVTWKNDISVYAFADNGSYTFTATDRAGNVTDYTAATDWITSQLPGVRVIYSTEEPTSQAVISKLVSTSADESIVILNNSGSAYHRFDENGTFTYRYTDAKGKQIQEVEARVDWIDTVPAKITVATDRDTISNQPLTVLFAADEDVNWPEMIEAEDSKHAKLVLEKNVPISFTVTDLTGYPTKVMFTTDLLDTDAPVITLPETMSIVAKDEEIDLLEGVIVEDENMNPEGLTAEHELDVHTPGTYTITYKAEDLAGNIAETTRSVTVYDPQLPQIFINGQLYTGNTVTMKQEGNVFETTGYHDNLSVNILKGKKRKGAFKTERTDISEELINGTYVFETPGYYTLLLRDQERRTELMQVYVSLEDQRQ